MRILDLFDTLHPGETWRSWRVFVAAVYGEPLDAAGLALFRQCTGRTAPRVGGYPEAVAVVGVQAGKSSVVATLAVHSALTGARGTHAVMVAQDHRGAMNSLLRHARQPFETVPAFRAEVTRETADTIELRAGTSLAAFPCRPAAIRGLRASVVAVDELAFFVSTDGRPTDVEMLRAARGRVATTSGRVVMLSSPYAQAGALYDLHRRHFGRDDSPILVWQASAPTMNPTLSDDYLVRMAEEDPDAYMSEVLGEFRAGLATLFDVDTLEGLVAPGVRERAPLAGVRYHAHYDPSGGRRDAAALAIAHADGERAVLDLLRAWPAPHNPGGVIEEASAILRAYGLARVQVDRFAGEFPREAFRRHGVDAEVAERSTSDSYLELVAIVNAGAAVLLDEPELLRELRGLERRRGNAGRDRVDHRPGSHDDRAAAVCGALVLASQRSKRPTRLTWGDGPRPHPAQQTRSGRPVENWTREELLAGRARFARFVGGLADRGPSPLEQALGFRVPRRF